VRRPRGAVLGSDGEDEGVAVGGGRLGRVPRNAHRQHVGPARVRRVGCVSAVDAEGRAGGARAAGGWSWRGPLNVLLS
jgi:hypothetical protein